MASTRQQEEKRIQLLRRMVALPHNRNCFDCGQRGPTYVNMTIGSFVCTACSGVLRGLNPPHRVKSISMGTFSQEDVDFLLERGNEYNRQVWLNGQEAPQIDNKDELKLRDNMTQKYERRRWYAEPTPDLAETAKVMNSQTSSGSASASVRRPQVSSNMRISAPPSSGPRLQGFDTATSKPPPVSSAASSAANATRSNTIGSTTSSDLLSDIFASSAPPVSASATNSKTSSSDFSQPNFANFSSMSASPPNSSLTAGGSSAGMAAMNSLFPSSTDDTQASLNIVDLTATTSIHSGAGLPVTSPPTSNNQWSSNAPATADKYASLSGLFSDDVSGSSGGDAGLGWGASGSAAVSSSATGSNNSWSNGAMSGAAQSGMSWGATAAQPAAAAPGLFGQPAAAVTQPQQQWGMGVQTSGVNPFLVSSAAPVNQQSAAGGSAGFGMNMYQNPPAASGGFAAFGAQPNPMAQTTLTSGFQYQQQQTQPQVSAGNPFGGAGMMGMSSGGFGAAMPAQNGGGGLQQWGGGPATSQWGVQPQQQQQNQWGGASAMSSNQWGAQPNMSKPATSVNPFLTQMSANTMATQSSNNPFL